jgi:uncharacterized protein YceK
MRFIAIASLIVALSGCATVNFQAYEGKNSVQEGQGGTKVVSDGVDFWANGAPPRKYLIIGVIDSEIGEGLGDMAILRAAVASEVKKQGGNAAIQIDSAASFGGAVRTAPGLFMAISNKKIKYSVVKYVD